MTTTTELRRLPAVDRLVEQVEMYAPDLARHDVLVEVARAVLDIARAAIRQGALAPSMGVLITGVVHEVRHLFQPSLQPVINATGVIIHTNLGRAPLSDAARAALDALASGYSNLEYDLAQGTRGSRYVHAASLLCRLSGAEAAVVVNNNAAAVFLTLSALAAGREVVISRGQLVEIGGGFRIPDVLRASGAQLVEVGTTNRTHLRDYAAAMGAQTAALMRVHYSNFRQIGFTAEVELADLVTLARANDLWVFDDLGSGSLLDTTQFGLSAEPTPQASIAAGADVVTFSGDKLLGGPQAGIIIGRAELIERIKSHPLARALRVDKLTLAALNATLLHYVRGEAAQAIPVWQMVRYAPVELQARVDRWVRRLQEAGLPASAAATESTVGGGSLPGETLPSWSLALDVPAPQQWVAQLRAGSPPVVARIAGEQVLFDARTVMVEQEDALLGAILAIWQNQ